MAVLATVVNPATNHGARRGTEKGHRRPGRTSSRTGEEQRGASADEHGCARTPKKAAKNGAVLNFATHNCDIFRAGFSLGTERRLSSTAIENGTWLQKVIRRPNPKCSLTSQRKPVSRVSR